jgi:hypothetical protein
MESAHVETVKVAAEINAAEATLRQRENLMSALERQGALELPKGP